MRPVSPAAVLKRVAQAIPEDCRDRLVVVGSLAAGYHLFGDDASRGMRTKDVDCLLAPRAAAASVGREIAERLVSDGWEPQLEEPFPAPGDASTPADRLPAIRLRPPDEFDWFLELLTVSVGPADRQKQWLRVKVGDAHYGLPSFGFLALAAHRPIRTRMGISLARNEMMVLANLLEHERIRPALIAKPVGDRRIKRTNKDLGRVLAIARLSSDEVIETWPKAWAEALREKFPEDWRVLATGAGDGLRALLASPEDLDEAHHSCVVGLLAANAVTAEQLAIAGERLVQDAVEPLAELAAE